jgi:hypothetical protein
MIDYLIEVIFKDVPIKRIAPLLKELIYNGKKTFNYNLTCDWAEIDWNNEASIEEVFVKNNNFGLFVNLKELNMKNICLPNCGIAVYKYEDTINLEINFQLSDLNDVMIKDLTKNLMKLSKDIAIQYQIGNYFCGLEPAQDVETRLFTNEQLGPFSIYTCSTSKAPKANRFKSSEIEEKIEVNIKCNIDLDFLFDFREF